MDRNHKRGAGSRLSTLAGVCLLLAGAMVVFYAAYKVSYVSVDYKDHLAIVEELDWRHPLQMLKAHPEPVWHLLVRAAMRVGGFGLERAGGLVSGGLCALTYLIAAFFLYHSFGTAGTAVTAGARSAGADRQGSLASGTDRAEGRLSIAGAAAFALLLSLSSAIYIRSFNKTPYLGQGSPNPWHNPTTIMVRPIALLIFVLVMGECLRVQRAGFGKGQGLRIWKGLLLMVLLVLSNLSKPSFVQIFYPAIFLLMFLWLFVYRGKNFPLALQLLVCCLPSVALMGMQFLAAFYSKTNSKSAGIMIAPFKVAGLYTDNIPVSTLLLLAFPLAVSLCGIIRRRFDWIDFFAWLMLLVGMGEKFLLAENGSRLWHGNFSWGYILGTYLLWFVVIRDFAAWMGALRGSGTEGGFRRAASALGFALCGILLLAHFLSGIYYLYYLIVLGNGV